MSDRAAARVIIHMPTAYLERFIQQVRDFERQDPEKIHAAITSEIPEETVEHALGLLGKIQPELHDLFIIRKKNA